MNTINLYKTAFILFVFFPIVYLHLLQRFASLQSSFGDTMCNKDIAGHDITPRDTILHKEDSVVVGLFFNTLSM